MLSQRQYDFVSMISQNQKYFFDNGPSMQFPTVKIVRNINQLLSMDALVTKIK